MDGISPTTDRGQDGRTTTGGTHGEPLAGGRTSVTDPATGGGRSGPDCTTGGPVTGAYYSTP